MILDRIVGINNNNNNCTNSIVPISLNSSRSEARQKLIHLASHTQGQTKVVIGAWNRRQFMVEKQFQINIFQFLQKMFIVSEYLIAIGS